MTPSTHAGGPTADEPCLWLRPGVIRRDCEPHRANWLRLFGYVSLTCGVLSWIVLPALLVSVPLGVAVCLLARHDRKRMAAGLMDPEGRDQTEEAQRLAFSGVLFSLLLAVLLLGMLLMALGQSAW
jgi:hypothetical protein